MVEGKRIVGDKKITRNAQYIRRSLKKRKSVLSIGQTDLDSDKQQDETNKSEKMLNRLRINTLFSNISVKADYNMNHNSHT